MSNLILLRDSEVLETLRELFPDSFKDVTDLNVFFNMDSVVPVYNLNSAEPPELTYEDIVFAGAGSAYPVGMVYYIANGSGAAALEIEAKDQANNWEVLEDEQGAVFNVDASKMNFFAGGIPFDGENVRLTHTAACTVRVWYYE